MTIRNRLRCPHCDKEFVTQLLNERARVYRLIEASTDGETTYSLVDKLGLERHPKNEAAVRKHVVMLLGTGLIVSDKIPGYKEGWARTTYRINKDVLPMNRIGASNGVY